MTLRHVLVLAAMLAILPGGACGQPVEPVLSLAKKEKPALLETLKDLVSIESGSRDIEGLDKLADLIAGRLKDLGGQVELVEPSDVYKMEDTPEKIGKMVRATFTGSGTQEGPAPRPHGYRLSSAACWRSSRSASPASAPMGWASPTTSRASPSSCIRCPCSRRWISATTGRSRC